MIVYTKHCRSSTFAYMRITCERTIGNTMTNTKYRTLNREPISAHTGRDITTIRACRAPDNLVSLYERFDEI